VHVCTEASYGFTYLRSARAPHEGICRQVEEVQRRENEYRRSQGRFEGGGGGYQMEVFKEGEGLISLGPPYVLGAKEVDESVLLLPCAARQCFTAKALAHRDRFLFLFLSLLQAAWHAPHGR
jgi:hypothetical protein